MLWEVGNKQADKDDTEVVLDWTLARDKCAAEGDDAGRHGERSRFSLHGHNQIGNVRILQLGTPIFSVENRLHRNNPLSTAARAAVDVDGKNANRVSGMGQ